MTDPLREGERLPSNDAPQGIDRWARHGVEELAERDAQERAELGDPDVPALQRAEQGAPGGPTDAF